MNLKDDIYRLFDEINPNLENICPTKKSLENALARPIHQAFKSIQQEHYRKLYREISRVTHPDKIRQYDSNAASNDPVAIFQQKIYALSQKLDSSEQDVFLCAPQQLIETYKDHLPSVLRAVKLELGSESTTLSHLVNRLMKAMLMTINQYHWDSERYNSYVQTVILSIQTIVNVLLLLLFTIIIFVVSSPLAILIYYNFSVTLVCMTLPFFLYLRLREVKDWIVQTGLNATLLFVIGMDALDKGLKVLMPTSQLAKDYRAHYREKDETVFTEEDSDESVLLYARSQLYTNSYDIELKKLRRLNMQNQPLSQYLQILLLGFSNAMKMSFPTEQSLVSQCLSSSVHPDYLVFYYRKDCHAGTTTVFDTVNARMCHYRSSVSPWLGFYQDSFNDATVVFRPSHVRDTNGFTVVTQQDMNPGRLPIIHHIDDMLYRWSELKQELEPLSFPELQEVQLPSYYIQSSDSIFYFDKTNQSLYRLNFNEFLEYNSPKSQYILFEDMLFYYDNFTNDCKKLSLRAGPLLDDLKEKFPYTTRIDTLNTEQLDAIKEKTQHSNHSSQLLFISLKFLRAVCFIPFIMIETLLYLQNILFKFFITGLMLAGFGIKLGVTLLLNVPLYAYEAFVHPKHSPEDVFEPEQHLTITPILTL